jgi:hypothetical protein
MHISAFSCFFSFLINRLCAALCSWLITCFTIIRFINIFRQFNTVKSNIILFTSLFVIFSIANSYSIIVLEYDPGQKQQTNQSLIQENSTFFDYQIRCSIRSKYANDNFILLMNTLVTGVLNLALPSILILIVNIAILCFIKRIYTIQTHDTVNRRSDVANYRSTLSTLLVISITYTLVYVPYCIFYLLMIILEDRNHTLHYWSEIAYILRFVSHSVNFYAYIFTNLRFRRDILIFLNYLCRPCFYFKKRQQYKHKKRSQIIILDKCRLPPPLPVNSSKGGKCQRVEDIHDQNQIDLKQEQEQALI